MTWVPTAALRADAGIGYLDATIDRFDNKPLVLQPADLVAGNKLPYAPEWQGHVGLACTLHAGAWAITPRVDASCQSQTFFDAANTVEIARLGGYSVLNAQVVLRREQGARIGLTLGVNNATDKIYRVAGNSSLTTGSGYAETAYARPRLYFATVNYDFWATAARGRPKFLKRLKSPAAWH
ncbi:MAG: TonB-dependent receptor [Gammaproteobacteria bacterium]|nr:TonB-dependent receptor [Gammaproteobacteria bacterium]